MSHKAAVFIVDALESHSKPYEIRHLEFAGINLGELGIRRICELLCTNPHLKLVVIGTVSDPALKIIAESIPSFVGVQTLSFEYPVEKKWSKENMNAFIEAFKENEVLMDVKVEGENAKGFVKELQFHAQHNRKKAELSKYLDLTQKMGSTEKIFECVT